MTEKADPKKDQIEKQEQLPPDVLPPELAQRIPKEVRQEVNAFFMRVGGSAHPIASKITPEHIAKSLDLAQDNANKNFEFAKGGRWFQFAIFGISVAVFIFLIVFLQEKPTVLTPILTALLGFGGGFGIGKKTG